MKSNLTPFALDELTIEQIRDLDIADLAQLHSEIRDAAAQARKRITKLVDGLELRFAARAGALLAKEGKDTGAINFPETGWNVKRTAKKTVKYDQDVMAEIRGRIAAAGENPDTYMNSEFSLNESTYKDWPANIQGEFDKARTVKPSRAEYDFTVPK